MKNFTLKKLPINIDKLPGDNFEIMFIGENNSDFTEGFSVNGGFFSKERLIDKNLPLFVKEFIIEDTTCTHTDNNLPCEPGWTDLRHFKTSINGNKMPSAELWDDILNNLLINGLPWNDSNATITDDDNNVISISKDIVESKNTFGDQTHQGEIKHKGQVAHENTVTHNGDVTTNGQVKHNEPLQLKKDDGTYKNLNEHINLETNINDIGSLLAVDFTSKTGAGDYDFNVLDQHSVLINPQIPFQVVPNKLDGPGGTAPMGSQLAFRINFTQDLPQGVYQLELKFKQTNNKNIDILFKSGNNLINSYSQERYYDGSLTASLPDNERENLTTGRFIYNLDTEWLTKLKIELVNNGEHGMTLDYSAKNFPTPTNTPTYLHHISNAGASFKPVTTGEQTITNFLEIIFVPADSTEITYTPYEIEFDVSDQFVRPFIRFSRVASE